MIITLAGHVDHGKSALVFALTGTKTDRLAEEKRRGLTLDLGFAYTDLGEQRIGFVDVPGHHRFIHNMVAGVAGDQFALLVVAADDGVMPQTREHLDILRIMALRRGCIALTKCDLVDAARIEEVRAEIAQLTQGTFLAEADLFACSALDPSTLNELRTHLTQAAAGAGDATIDATTTQPPFRLAVDRSFSLQGAGCVATGTVHSGRVTKGDNLVIGINKTPVRVRDLRVQDSTTQSAERGDRCSLNIAGIEHRDVSRGDWLLAASAHNATQQVVMDFQTLPGVRLRHWRTVHVHLAASHTLGRLALLDQLGDAAQQDTASRLVELVLDEPLQAKHGDTLVVRDYARQATLGGGRVIYAGSASPRRRGEARLKQLHAYQSADAEDALQALLTLGPVQLNDWQATYLLPTEQREKIVEGTGAHGLSSDTTLWVTPKLYQASADAVMAAVKNAKDNGTTLSELAQQCALSMPLVRSITNDLTRKRQLKNVRGRLHLPDFGTQLSDSLQALLDRVTPLLDGPQPASAGDLSKQLNVPLPKLDKALQAIAKTNALVRIGDKRYALPSQVQGWAELCVTLANTSPFSVKAFRDQSGLGRNLCIDLLEYFDGRGFTRRNGDTRIVAGGMERLQ